MKYCIINKNDDVSKSVKDLLLGKIKLEYNSENPDYVIAIGGDGTILAATHQYESAIIFGIHTGHLGFFANYSLQDIETLADDINNNSFCIEKLDLLSAKINDREEVYNALNEISVINPPRTLILDVYIDDIFFERFRGTGFCVSTPSGSTAYNKSLHGSVIDPKIKAFQLTEIAGINSTAYRTFSSPLVLASDRRVRFEAIGEEEIFITTDNISFTERKFKKIEFIYGKNTVSFGYHNKQSFVNRIKRTFVISES